MISTEKAQELVQDWIEIWNSHNIDNIISQYSDDVIFTSPFVAKLLGDESGAISGKEALKSLFTKALEEYPDLKFEFHDVLIGVNSLTLLYKSVNELLAEVVVTLDSEGKILKSILHFSIHASNTDN